MQLLRPVVAVQLSVAESPDLITSLISGGTGNTNIFTNEILVQILFCSPS